MRRAATLSVASVRSSYPEVDRKELAGPVAVGRLQIFHFIVHPALCFSGKKANICHYGRRRCWFVTFHLKILSPELLPRCATGEERREEAEEGEEKFCIFTFGTSIL